MRGASACMECLQLVTVGCIRGRISKSVPAASRGLDGMGRMDVFCCLFTFQARRAHQPHSSHPRWRGMRRREGQTRRS